MLLRDKKIYINKNAKYILDILHSHGYEAYIVGGCVRDVLIGKVPFDYDITTNALPAEVKKMFKHTVDTGIKHGTVSVLLKTKKGIIKTYEVTTYRIDGEYTDGRHPKDVKYVKNLKEDLSRRDFTVNAIAYNDEEGFIDLFDGMSDIDKKIIRAVGIPKDRYEEDALRMLRAIRFSAKLGFSIEKDTYNAIKLMSKNLVYVSKERVQDELNKILLSDRPTYIKYLYDTNLSKYVCEDFDDIRPEDKYLINTKKLHIAYAGLLYQNEKNCVKILKELKLDNKTIEYTDILLKLKDKYIIYNNKKFDINETSKVIDKLYEEYTQKKIINEIGYDLFLDFLELINKVENIYVKDICNNILKIKKEKKPIFLDDLAANGNDLKSIGYEGKEIGIALKYLLDIVHRDCRYNNKKTLLSIADKVYKEVCSK